MNRANNSLLTDMAFLMLLLLCFGGMIFMSLDGAHIVQNGIMFCGATVVLLITYFSTLKAGLISVAAVDLLLVAYTLFHCTITSEQVQLYVYFWLVWLPIIVIMLALFLRRSMNMRKENIALHELIASQSMMDDETGLKNLRFFEIDAKRSMYYSKRCDIPLYLIVWELQFEEELRAIVGTSDLEEVIRNTSNTIETGLGEDEEVYLLSRSPYMWGALIFCEYERLMSLNNHVLQSLAQGSNNNTAYYGKTHLVICHGFFRYDGSTMTSFALLQRAKVEIDRESSFNGK